MEEVTGLSTLENAKKTMSEYDLLYVCLTVLLVNPVHYVLFLNHIFSVMQVVIKHVFQNRVDRLPMVSDVCPFS